MKLILGRFRRKNFANAFDIRSGERYQPLANKPVYLELNPIVNYRP
jgi:hypothetical protein